MLSASYFKDKFLGFDLRWSRLRIHRHQLVRITNIFFKFFKGLSLAEYTRYTFYVSYQPSLIIPVL